MLAASSVSTTDDVIMVSYYRLSVTGGERNV